LTVQRLQAIHCNDMLNITVVEPKTNSAGKSQGYVLRKLCYDFAVQLAVNPSANEADLERARAVTGLVKGWSESNDQVRITSGKPLPGSLRPVGKPKSKPRGKAGALITYPGPSANSAPAVVNDSPSAVTPTTGGAQIEPVITLEPQVSQETFNEGDRVTPHSA